MVWNLISPNEILAFWGIPNFWGPILKTTLPLSKDAHHIPGQDLACARLEGRSYSLSWKGGNLSRSHTKMREGNSGYSFLQHVLGQFWVSNFGKTSLSSQCSKPPASYLPEISSSMIGKYHHIYIYLSIYIYITILVGSKPQICC